MYCNAFTEDKRTSYNQTRSKTFSPIEKRKFNFSFFLNEIKILLFVRVKCPAT